ncbi:MAG: Na+/H+ antiporter NhaA [Candidatus Nomurabacteria bacterium]|nr:MAG: Na+/H+ antiporter NhaA [Candidatus Nomurabacteria bacterium]
MEAVRHLIYRMHPLRVSASLSLFLRDETIGGKLVIVAALLSLLVVNSPLQNLFLDFWHQSLSIGFDTWRLDLSLKEWLNEGLMALFFLVVGLEIKREFMRGELRDHKTAILPIGAAIGGVLLPAILYLDFTAHTNALQGWGIPIATDTAIAVAILSLLGDRVPIQLKIFLLALAVADDMLAILVISLFYTGGVNLLFVGCSIFIIIMTYLFRSFLSTRLLMVIGLGILLWLTTHLSGVHASIVGVVMGLLAPISSKDKGVSTPEKVERFFLPLTTLFVVPLFAIANAGFVMSPEPFATSSFIIVGIVSGLLFGKVTGITLMSWLLVRLRIAQLPDEVDWRHIIGVGFIAGVGFTMSLFIAELAFPNSSSQLDAAKIGIFLASTISALVGLLILSSRRQES